MKVLFVDDELAVLEGLENRLRRLRRRWSMAFAQGAAAALEQLESSHFDVIVTDMRMPGMDGAALLKRVCVAYPHMIRLVLSGETGQDALLDALPVAHQLLSKPCQADVLEASIGRAHALEECLRSDAVKACVAGLTSLPALPEMYTQITELIESPEASSSSVAELVEQDMALLARLLQLVNSAFVAPPRSMSSAEEAVSYLGLNTVRSLVLMSSLFESVDHRRMPEAFSFSALQGHGFRVAQLACRLLSDETEARSAFAAALLHDIGCLVIASQLPDEYQRISAHAEAEGLSFFEAERATTQHTHAELGAYLLALWGLPYPIVEGVAHHHEPLRAGERHFGVVGAVHVANALASASSRACFEAAVDQRYLAHLQLEGSVDHWLELAMAHGPS